MSVVTPWKVVMNDNFSYQELLDQFGLKHIDEDIINRLKKISDEPINHLLLREIFYAHQDFDIILSHVEKGGSIYIYTGRGPSSEALHLGHTLPLIFTAYLQKVFNCMVVIQMSDEEKFYAKTGENLDDFLNYTEPNAKDLIACGFNPDKTFIFSSFKYEIYTRPLVAALNKYTSVHVTKKVFGFEDSINMGMMQWPAYQMAPAMCGAFPHLFGDQKNIMCLVPCAVDQAPYFRFMREPCRKLGFPEPALICCKFLPGLQGIGEKASSSGIIPPIFLNDTPSTVKHKINKYAFSGGKTTVDQHRQFGGDLKIDIPYIYLYYLLEDDIELQRIASEYSSGKMLSGEIKEITINVINNFLSIIQSKRNNITSAIYNKFFTINVQSDVIDQFISFKQKYIDINISF